MFGSGIFAFHCGWPFAELIMTSDEVIVRPRGFMRILGVRYSIADLSYAQTGIFGTRFVSPKHSRKVAFYTGDNWRVWSLLAQRGVEVRDRQGARF